MTIATEHDGDGAACEGHRDAPPVYNYGNWDEVSRGTASSARAG
jgi:hypothetical protein